MWPTSASQIKKGPKRDQKIIFRIPILADSSSSPGNVRRTEFFFFFFLPKKVEMSTFV
jgi:hypothetical protein